MMDYSNPEVLGGIVQWCQDNLEKLTHDETMQLHAALAAAASHTDDQGGITLTVDSMEPSAAADLQAVARVIAENHELVPDES